jgi:DNA (cytosine-5)-methyltransferase 1
MKVLDLFSGIGGFSLGLERAGMETVAFCEIDKKCHKVLKKHWPDVPIFDDVSTLTKEKLDERSITVDVICGGFPCQDLSVAGTGKGLEGSRSGLWFEYGRIISELRPRYVIVENVSALLNRGLDQVLGQLAQIGYDAEWHCIPASAVGAPHRRDRLWIVAYSNSNSERPRKRFEQSSRSTTGKCFSNSSIMGVKRFIPDSVFEGLERQRSISGRISEALNDTRNYCR